MRLVLAVSMLLLVAPPVVRGEGPIAILTGVPGGLIDVSREFCPDDKLFVHHDGTFEAGIAWEFTGVQEPYDGAFGEAFDLGPGLVECVSLWLTQDGWNAGQSTDVYVWEGGVAGSPGGVLAVVTGVIFENIPVWPDGARYDVEIPVSVTGGMSVGSWGNWPGAGVGYFWLEDLDGHADYSWTRIADGIGFPSGWQPIDTVFRDGTLGIGVHFTAGPTPVVPTTWAGVKHLFATGR